VTADEMLPKDAVVGRQIYRNGTDGSNTEIKAHSALLGDTVSASRFPCVNCHGQDGEGRSEGGLSIPSVTGQALANAGYDDSALRKLIVNGVDVKATKIHDAMPRYSLSEKQLRQLTSYLHQLGKIDQFEIGISETDIRLATLLPLTGGLAGTGQLLKATLEACIQDINEHESIYGRKLSLGVIDSGGTQADSERAIIQAMNDNKPFAVISALLPTAEEDVLTVLLNHAVPVIAPLTFHMSADLLKAPGFYAFLPTYSHQSQALIDFWMEKRHQYKLTELPRVAIVTNDAAIHADIVAAITAQLKKHNVQNVVVIHWSPTEFNQQQTVLTLKKAKINALFFLGNSGQLATLSNALTHLDDEPELLGLLATMRGDSVKQANLPVTAMWLASPFLPDHLDISSFAERLSKQSVPLTSPSLQMVSCAALDFVVQGLKRTGKGITREKFVKHLDSINNFRVGNMPPLTFDVNNRTGVSGAFMLKVNPKTGAISEISDWVSPQGL
jgi:ABC-type branched-subunit amino acid transport system substrate-binding protein